MRLFRETCVLEGAQDFYIQLLLLVLVHILVQVFKENTHSLKLRRKLYVKKSLRSVAFSKTQGFHSSCALVQLAAKVKPAAKAKVATESGVHDMK